MLATVVNERQNDWDAPFRHVKFTYNHYVSAETGLASNEVNIGRLRRFPLSLFERPRGGGNHSFHRDQLDYYLATDRQQISYALVREHHALAVPPVACRNSILPDALQKPSGFPIGNWLWVYTSVATIRQGACKGIEETVLKEKLVRNWTESYKILVVGKTPPTANLRLITLLYLDLPSDRPGSHSKRRVSVVRCRPCSSPHDGSDALNNYTTKSPPYDVTQDDVSPALECFVVDHGTGHQSVRGRGGHIAVMYETHCHPSWDRKAGFQHSH